MYERVDLDLILPCLNYVPVSVHVDSVVHLPGCTLSLYGTKYPVYWALMMNVT